MADARRARPEAEAWLALLEQALLESEAGTAWRAAGWQPAADHRAKVPLMAHSQITLDAQAVRAWVRRLLKLAPQANGRPVDGLALLEAALNQDDARLDALARGAGAEAQALRVVAQVAALPLLQVSGARLGPAVPSAWWEGYCPLCGAWPVVAEYVGLERKRQLRCGRCGTGWAIPLLRCVFCDETRHEQLGYLAPEGSEEMRKVEVCDSCKGYVKGLTTVRPLPPWAVLLDDLLSVPLDVAALERGYHRPVRPGYALETRIVEQRRLPLFRFALGPRPERA